MRSNDLDTARRDAGKATGLVRDLADQVQAMASTDGADRCEIASLAATLESLADNAVLAAGGIDDCLRWAKDTAHDTPGAGLALAELATAHALAALLAGVVDTAVAVYAQACRLLADRVALAEEYRSTTGESQPGFAAAVLVATAQH